jgi:hypothetical protein
MSEIQFVMLLAGVILLGVGGALIVIGIREMNR